MVELSTHVADAVGGLTHPAYSVELRGVSRTFGPRRPGGRPRTVLSDVDLVVRLLPAAAGSRSAELGAQLRSSLDRLGVLGR